MIAIVLSRTRHALTHSVFGSSLAGDGMLVRLRSISILLLGLVTAVGLGLIVFISQLGFPGVFSAPIPGNRTEVGAVHSAIALTRSAGAGVESPAPGTSARVRAHTPKRSQARDEPTDSTHPGIGGSKKFAATGPNSVVAQPPSAPASEPTSQPAAPSPAPTTVLVQNAPKSSPAAQAKQHADAQPKSNGTPQVKDDTGSKSVAAAVGKATSDHSGQGADSPASPSKPSEPSSGKSSKDQSVAAKPVASPAPVTPAKDAPLADDPASGKEAGDAEGSDGPPE